MRCRLPVGAISEGETKYIIDPEACIECGSCESECPVGARRPSKIIFKKSRRLLRAALFDTARFFAGGHFPAGRFTVF